MPLQNGGFVFYVDVWWVYYNKVKLRFTSGRIFQKVSGNHCYFRRKNSFIDGLYFLLV